MKGRKIRQAWKNRPKLAAAFGRWMSRRRLALVLGVSVLAALAVPLALSFATSSGVDRAPYVVIEAKTELVRFRVVRPTIAKIGLLKAKANAEIPGCAVAKDDVTGLLEPEVHSLVTYRSRSRSYSVEIESSGLVAIGDGRPTGEAKKSRLILPGGTECLLPASVRFTTVLRGENETPSVDLPIAGPAEIGAELGPVSMGEDGPLPLSGLLREGKVRIFGRAGFWSAPALHTVADSEMILPAGARLSSGNIDSVPDGLPPWYGLITFSGDYLTVSASTVSAELLLFGPGATGDAERLGLRMITRLLNDPGLALLLVGLASFAFVFQTLAAIAQLADRR